MNPDSHSEKVMLRTVVLPGIVIGLAAALILFAFTSGRSAPRPAPPTATAQAAQLEQSPTPRGLTPTATPVLFQFNQIRAAVGEPAPYFTLNDLNGIPVSLKDFVGRPIVLNMWATWCKPCEYEMPGLEKVYQKYQDQGLVVLGINQTSQDDPDAVREFVKAHGIHFPVLLDEEGYSSSSLYGLKGLPMSYFIDTNFVLRRIQVGAMLPEKVDEYVQEILSK